MDTQQIYTTLLDQLDERNDFNIEDYVMRKESGLLELDSKLAQVVIGVRRSGKSTLCHMALKERGIEYAYVNFDDDRFATLKIDDLNDVLTTIYRIYGTEVKYMFFDEIQNVDGWHLFVNRLLRQGHRIVLTGSNAKLLSGELVTHLTGRYNKIELYPFSYADVCRQFNVESMPLTTKGIATRQNVLDRYLREGGFPELEGITNRHNYVSGLIETIITKDIKTRYKIRNVSGLKTLAAHLIANSGQLINIEKIEATLKIGTDKTIRNYIDHLAQAYLILPIRKFSYKSKERLRDEKSYIVDTGMMTYSEGATLSPENIGWRLENVVYIELLRRHSPLFHEIYYYRPTSRSREVDFVVTRGNKPIELIQVSYDISNDKTLNREKAALVEAAEKLRCENLTLVANSNSRTITVGEHQIKVVSSYEWLSDAYWESELTVSIR